MATLFKNHEIMKSGTHAVIFSFGFWPVRAFVANLSISAPVCPEWKSRPWGK
jgi:hypothetical protein